MTKAIFYMTIVLVLVMCQGTECRKYVPSPCAAYIQDTVLLNASVENSSLVYRLNDTIWITSTISDNLNPLSGSGSFIVSLDQFYMNVQPFSVITSTSLPQLQYANIEFNMIVTDGLLQNAPYPGYNFLYRRTAGLNSLKIGFVVGRTGLYIISCTNNRYFVGGMATFNRPNDPCTTYWGISSFPGADQNKDYWDSLGVTAVSLPANYGSLTISKSMRNYFFFKVVP